MLHSHTQHKHGGNWLHWRKGWHSHQERKQTRSCVWTRKHRWLLMNHTLQCEPGINSPSCSIGELEIITGCAASSIIQWVALTSPQSSTRSPETGWWNFPPGFAASELSVRDSGCEIKFSRYRETACDGHQSSVHENPL